MQQTRFAFTLLLAALAAAPLALAQDAPPSVVLYDGQGYSGPPQVVIGAEGKLDRLGFDDRASSLRVRAGQWELCDEAEFKGRCELISESQADLGAIGLNNALSSLRPAVEPASRKVDADIVLYSGRNYSGQARGFDDSEAALSHFGFNDEARSVEVNAGVWLLCEDREFDGQCELVDRSVRDLRDLDLDREVSSLQRSPYAEGPSGYGAALFDRTKFRGRFIGVDQAHTELRNEDFNDDARSILVNRGRWLICEDQRYGGRCEVVSRSIADLEELGLDRRISSIQPYDGRREDPRGRRGGPRAEIYGGEKTEGQVAAFFPAPKAANDGPVDACLGEDSGCAQAADAFCRRAGYARAGFSAKRMEPLRTYDLDGAPACEGEDCEALTDILCVAW